jgi:hypothetical protein
MSMSPGLGKAVGRLKEKQRIEAVKSFSEVRIAVCNSLFNFGLSIEN